MQNIQPIWCEKYRPTSIEDCILPERLKKLFRTYVTDKFIPNLILSGTAGVGKTSVAIALCKQIGCDYMVINGSDEGRLIDTFRFTIKTYASSLSLAGGRKVIIIDEADYLNAESVQPALRNFIEEYSDNCSFIFTCNYKTRIIEPLHSRCSTIDFTLHNEEKASMASSFYKRVQQILSNENVEYIDKVVIEVIKKHFPDFRRVINELQRFSSYGKIDTNVLSQIGDISIDALVDSIKNKDFGYIRKWVATSDIDSTTLFRKIYDNLYDILLPSSIPQAVIILGEYGYKSAFVADQEINTVACLTELMVNLEFK